MYEHGLIHRPGSPGAKSEAGGGKRRQRKRHDPNAPKRALTPYFLYMQNNRSQIAEDLGEGARPIDVSAEGTNRWVNMPEVQKAVRFLSPFPSLPFLTPCYHMMLTDILQTWKKLYLDNLAKYRQEMSEYKEKKEKGVLTYDQDHAASNQLQQDVETAEASQAGSDEDESEDEEEEGEPSPSPEPQKEPSPPRSGKRRRSEGAKVTTPKAAETAKSPEKKKRGGAKKDKEEEAPPSSARKNATGDSKRPKKKRRSEVGGDE